MTRQEMEAASLEYWARRIDIQRDPPQAFQAGARYALAKMAEAVMEMPAHEHDDSLYIGKQLILDLCNLEERLNEK